MYGFGVERLGSRHSSRDPVSRHRILAFLSGSAGEEDGAGTDATGRGGRRVLAAGRDAGDGAPRFPVPCSPPPGLVEATTRATDGRTERWAAGPGAVRSAARNHGMELPKVSSCPSREGRALGTPAQELSAGGWTWQLACRRAGAGISLDVLSTARVDFWG
jgi:hypothetical protein